MNDNWFTWIAAQRERDDSAGRAARHLASVGADQAWRDMFDELWAAHDEWTEHRGPLSDGRSASAEEIARSSRRRQGLPAYVTDPVALDRLAALLDVRRETS